MSNDLSHLCPETVPVDPSTYAGWIGLDTRNLAIQASIPVIVDESEFILANEPPSPILLYQAWREVLGKDPDYPAQQIGDCFPAGTMVLGEAVKPIEQVRVGDGVWTARGDLTRVISTRTIETVRPLVRLKVMGGLPLTCTADHRVLACRVPVVSGKRVTRHACERAKQAGTSRPVVVQAYEGIRPEWVAAGDLTTDHYLLAPESHDVPDPPDDDRLRRIWNEPAGRWLLGYFVGDGHASGGSVEFAFSVADTATELLGTLIELGFNPKASDYGEGRNAGRFRVHSRELVECFRRHFYDVDGAKIFPAWAIGDMGFVRGLTDTDGCEQGSWLSVSSTSLSVVHGLACSLRTLGHEPTIAESARSKGTYANAKPLYVVRWTHERIKHKVWRDHGFVFHQVREAKFLEGPSTVYDIGVEDEHHSFVANGYAVHNCVSFGHAHANDLLQCIEIYFGEQSEFRETDTEFIYGASREVAGILGPFDGSYGSAAVKAMTQIGIVSREQLGDDGPYSGSRAKKWGRTGPPEEVKLLAAPYKIGAVAKISTRAQAISCLWNLSPFTICSNQGFTMTRDSKGHCAARGSWGHCMFVCGFDPATNCYLICQSWGPNTPDGPLYLEQPTFSFWCDASVMERNILRADDSWGLFRSPDFAKKRGVPADWTVARAA